eukprot:761552-Alexandrium_andersonii.AAC.1
MLCPRGRQRGGRRSCQIGQAGDRRPFRGAGICGRRQQPGLRPSHGPAGRSGELQSRRPRFGPGPEAAGW